MLAVEARCSGCRDDRPIALCPTMDSELVSYDSQGPSVADSNTKSPI